MTTFVIPPPGQLLLAIDTSNWPAWAATLWPATVKWGLVAASAILILALSWVIKQVILFTGRRLSKTQKDFENSSWQLAASVSRFLAFFILLPLPLGLAGFDWRELINTYGPGVFGAVAVLVVAVVVANSISSSLRKFGARAHAHSGADDTLIAFSASLVKYIIFAIALVFALSQLGFPAASLAAVLGAAGLAIGLALQDTLKSVAAGVMLAIFRPFRIGDYVGVAGLEGTITNITPFTTSLRQIDNKIVSITNDKVWGDPLINFTAEPQRRLDMYFDISYNDDIDHALGVLQDVANTHPLVQNKDTTWVGVHALAESSVKLRLRAWVPTTDFIQVRADLNKNVKQTFDREKISIPYPHQVQVDDPRSMALRAEQRMKERGEVLPDDEAH
ncbi:MAG: mechanosensitive ion channel family protein [Hyphomonas sp.]|uniref:mechanosensitive ion channel family protein n=1 Tax=Hyphomonas sp. TaxID=87 RepID=UPI0017F1DB72|nr:mechanosensitive ion channel family protein [Hyphomonas sp.]MBU3919033.1 mechanosensitive ion channel family protein [Alphaproteobacteria bacterium]MBA3069426.1 mechanosensitive ion channel family protein [Hyphomonas sp.]MBU4063808.1 mechanosensitive ion channel family protein [Alphaproteobacteria bacterium]MBU4164231.1 mechanosensitive ion channel family protein [Alphaproteobacteria bacterium]MBU4567429.1 mechanosensitive ion channel family protein [Alphaproteobacteria bacterium]